MDQVKARCHQETSHYLSLCWSRFMPPSGDYNNIDVLPHLSQRYWKWPQCTKMRFSERIFIVTLDSNFTEFGSQRSNWQCISIDSRNKLAPKKHRVIIWTNVYIVLWYHFASHSLMWGNSSLPCDAIWRRWTGSLLRDDVIKWKHFLCYRPFVGGIHRSLVNSPHKGQWRGALIFSLICVWIKGWLNNREAGDLRRHRVHYDVTLMVQVMSCRLWGTIKSHYMNQLINDDLLMSMNA